MRPTWVLWWLLAILISVVCIAFTGVKRAYAQDCAPSRIQRER